QLELTVCDLDLALGADGAHIGLVDPLDLATAAANPDRMRERIVERAPETDVAGKLAVLRDDFGDLLAVARDITKAQDRAPAGDAAVSLHIATGARAQQQIEGLALREERIELGLEVARCLGLEPGAEPHEELGVLG